MKKRKEAEGVLKKLIKSKLFVFVFALGIISMMGTGVAIWSLNHNGITGLVITSQPQVIFSDTLATSLIDTTNSSFQKIETITLINTDGIINYEVLLNKTIVDVVDGCTLDQDVVFEVVYDSITLTDGDSINVSSGNSDITITTDAKRFSCPQNASLEVNLNPI